VEPVILTPVLLALIWLIIQYILPGKQVALAAAQIGPVARQDASTVPGWRAIAEHSARATTPGSAPGRWPAP
jgi:hypothetical protein